jgi:hypothetical protein
MGLGGGDLLGGDVALADSVEDAEGDQVAIGGRVRDVAARRKSRRRIAAAHRAQVVGAARHHERPGRAAARGVGVA